MSLAPIYSVELSLSCDLLLYVSSTDLFGGVVFVLRLVIRLEEDVVIFRVCVTSVLALVSINISFLLELFNRCQYYWLAHSHLGEVRR